MSVSGCRSGTMASALRPATCRVSTTKVNPKQVPMCTNLNEVIRMNPESYQPVRTAQINFNSTSYNPVNFDANLAAVAQAQSRKQVQTAAGCERLAKRQNSSMVCGRRAQPMHSTAVEAAQITQGQTSQAFYRGYGISSYVQMGRPMAPNYHPEHQKALA